MPFLSFTTGQVLSSSDMNTMSKQTITTCTSSTRPSSPAVGTHIYETDTGELLMYYGATTGWRRPWSLPWGHVTEVSLGTNQTYANLTWGFPISWTGTPIANRRYRIQIHAAFSGGNVGQIQFAVGTAAASPLKTFGTYSNAANYPITGSIMMNFTTTGSSMTRGLSVVMATGSGNVQVMAGSVLTIDDIGPASTPPAS